MNRRAPSSAAAGSWFRLQQQDLVHAWVQSGRPTPQSGGSSRLKFTGPPFGRFGLDFRLIPQGRQRHLFFVISSISVWAIHQYRDARGRLPVKEWYDSLGTEEKARFDAKINVLKQNGPDQFRDGWCAPLGDGLLKLKIKGRRQLRPMLCKGPINISNELTLLREAIEKGGKLDPSDAKEQAQERMNAIAAEPAERRRPWSTKQRT